MISKSNCCLSGIVAPKIELFKSLCVDDRQPALNRLQAVDTVGDLFPNCYKRCRFVTAPFIYACIVPFVLLDLFVSIYQWVCFPVYGVPKARRRDYMAIDRNKLRYLNALEGLNCMYCSYANGLLAYVVEIAGRTEQHWCPIKHTRRVRHPHDRYSHFLSYGDASAYREQIENVRCDFTDIKGR